MKEIKEIVLTGGPCSGKTTGKNYLAEKLRDKGFRVFLVPEVASMVITGGVTDMQKLSKEDGPRHFEVEKMMLEMQMSLRRHFLGLAEIFVPEKTAVIYDRGPMDMKAYTKGNEFEAMMAELRLNIYDVRDSFDGVIHLLTAAKGAEAAYTCSNNEARHEDLAEARAADDKTLQAWLGHPHLKIIDNSADFKQKMRRSLQAVCRFLGVPVPLEIERKFLLSKPPNFKVKELKQSQKISIEQIYIESPDAQETRIRKRSQNGFSIYYLTKKTVISSMVRQEREEEIRAVDYLRMQSKKIPGTKVVKKNRYCFAYNNQYFELDIFIEPKRHCWLEIELTEENDSLTLPPFLEIEKEVTGDPAFTNFALAKE